MIIDDTNNPLQPECRICGNSESNREHLFREMMFGLREEFPYVECSKCGTIQIAKIPDLAPYYPPDYATLGVEDLPVSKKFGAHFAARSIAKYYLDKRHMLGGFFDKLVSKRTDVVEKAFPYYLREPFLDVRLDTKILDFGSGGGYTLRVLRYFGFTDLTGSDKFIDGEYSFGAGLTVYKRDLTEFPSESFDLVMLNHVLEHLPSPSEALGEVHRILPFGKYCIIRIPIIANAWKLYGRNWYQLDPPRHLYLFTEAGFRALAERQGFEVEKVTFDSTAEQFTYSELYSRDISLAEASETLIESTFDKAQLDEWRARARELNEESNGDQACFFLKKSTNHVQTEAKN